MSSAVKLHLILVMIIYLVIISFFLKNTDTEKILEVSVFKYVFEIRSIITLITLLRIPYLGQIGCTKLVLMKWHKYGILNRVIRVSVFGNINIKYKYQYTDT